MNQPTYQSRVDVPAVVREFLNELRPDDLLTELIQNDLDQGATLTRISITKNLLTCEGNGLPVDTKGWERLAVAIGAGEDVEAKANGIGIKNHGLRACFCLGDTIIIRSGGLRTQLTVCGKGGRRFYPATWDVPYPDEEAPARGCRIEVPLRKKPLTFTGSEVPALQVPTEASIRTLFTSTCTQAPQRFLGCFRPGFYGKYTLEVTHWSAGTFRFEYSVGPLRSRGSFRLYRRECRIEAPSGHDVIREDAFAFNTGLRLSRDRRIPRFYRLARRGVLSEIAWRLDERGRPVAASGQLRYPIGYSTAGASATTGLGVHFSAPFVSDRVRHGIAPGEEVFNSNLLAACDAALVKLLRGYLIPRYGPAVLHLLRDPIAPAAAREELLIEAAAASGALPAQGTVDRTARTRRGNSRRKETLCLPYRSEGEVNFVVPCFTWSQHLVSAELSALCPSNLAQLHPATPPFVVALLATKVYAGCAETYSTFDENDVITRLQPSADGIYPWPDAKSWREELGNPARVKRYLAIASAVIERNKGRSEEAENLRTRGMLPDVDGIPRVWAEMRRVKGIAPPVPGVPLPPFLHPELTDLPIFARKPLQIPKFDLDAHLSDPNLARVAVSGAGQFFHWLRGTGRGLIRGSTVERIAEHRLWPTTNGVFVRFADLCYVEDPQLRKVLGDHIHHPETAVLRFRGVRCDGRGLLRLRTYPTHQELARWYASSFGPFPSDVVLDAGAQARFRALEFTLNRLCARSPVRRGAPWRPLSHRTLDRTGALRSVVDLHNDSPSVIGCALLDRDRLGSSQPKLCRMLGARDRPAAAAVIRALKIDASRTSAVYVRVSALLTAIELGESVSERLDLLCIVPVGEKLYRASDLAMRGTPDYWGEWKVPLDTVDIPAERAAHLRAIGVTGRKPSDSTSQMFFQWLASQPAGVLKNHLDQVIRHLALEVGPLRWWKSKPDLPCLPVRTHGGGIRLVTYRDVALRAAFTLLPDFRELEEPILLRDRSRRLVVVEAPNVADTVLSRLQSEGIPSLRNTIGLPRQVCGCGTTRTPEWAQALLHTLQSSALARQLRKRLEEQHVPSTCLRTRWRHAVSAIREARIAPSVRADYRLGRQTYTIEQQAGLDPTTQVLWISDTLPDVRMSFYRAIAEQIFEPATPPSYAYGLRSAVEMEYRPRTLWELEPRGRSSSDPHDSEVDEWPSDEAGFEDREINPVHRSSRLDPQRNVPDPQPLHERSNSEAAGLAGRSAPYGQRRTRSRIERVPDPIEDIQINQLKEQHYAWHCQICLACAKPDQLAPLNSYVYYYGHRKRFMEAHHLDAISAGGSRGAENLIVLCEMHHHLLGDKLRRGGIARRLREEAVPHWLVFRAPPHVQRVQGVVIREAIDTEPYEVAIFFTLPHAVLVQEA